MVERSLTGPLLAALSDTPVVIVVGGRQTGKSTLVTGPAAKGHEGGDVSFDAPTEPGAGRRAAAPLGGGRARRAGGGAHPLAVLGCRAEGAAERLLRRAVVCGWFSVSGDGGAERCRAHLAPALGRVSRGGRPRPPGASPALVCQLHEHHSRARQA